MSVTKKLIGLGLDVAALPFSLAADVATMGGAVNESYHEDGRTYTGRNLAAIGRKIGKIREELEEE